jgi:hypothetical protein
VAIVAAGVGSGGTIAAGEFLSNSDDMVDTMHNAESRKNLEVVLSTEIINGKSGTPKVEATYFW